MAPAEIKQSAFVENRQRGVFEKNQGTCGVADKKTLDMHAPHVARLGGCIRAGCFYRNI